MRRLVNLTIPIPVAFAFLTVMAKAGNWLAERAGRSGLEMQIVNLERITR
jgi:hypothetical protein